MGVLALTFICALGVIGTPPASALAEPVYYIKEVTCIEVPPGSGSPVVDYDLWQERYTEGLEYWQALPTFWNIKAGRLEYGEWIEKGPIQDPYPYWGDTTEHVTYLPVAPGNYLFGLWFIWWYPTVDGGWGYQQRFTWAPADTYLHQVGAFNSRHPHTSCWTEPNPAENFEIVLRPSARQPSAAAMPSARDRVEELESLHAEARTRSEPSQPASLAVRRESPSCAGRTATIVGTEGPDRLIGSPGPDVIVGLGGNDEIFGLGGADRLCGGKGADGLAGSAGEDRLDGRAGADTLASGTGHDRILAGNGIDIVEGGAGRDRLVGGGQSLDILAYLTSPTGVTVRFTPGRAYGGGGKDSFSGFNAVVGSNSSDRLIGTTGEQWFLPLGGDDTVNGGEGQDVLAYLLAGQGVDVDLTASEAYGEGWDRPLSNLEVVFGSPFDDTIVGSTGYDLIYGQAGNDTLDGVAGGDMLDAGDGTADVCTNGAVFISCENQSSAMVGPVPPEPPLEEPPADPPAGRVPG